MTTTLQPVIIEPYTRDRYDELSKSHPEIERILSKADSDSYKAFLIRHGLDKVDFNPDPHESTLLKKLNYMRKQVRARGIEYETICYFRKA